MPAAGVGAAATTTTPAAASAAPVRGAPTAPAAPSAATAAAAAAPASASTAAGAAASTPARKQPTRLEGFTATLVKPPAPGAKVLRIGCLLPFSTDRANGGLASRTGIEMAVRDLAPSRLPGMGVELSCVDTKCMEVLAAKGGAKLARQNVNFMIVSCGGLPAANVATRFRVPAVSGTTTSTPLTIAGDYFYR